MKRGFTDGASTSNLEAAKPEEWRGAGCDVRCHLTDYQHLGRV